eukprot:3737967-Amphidinium_carterae.2
MTGCSFPLRKPGRAALESLIFSMLHFHCGSPWPLVAFNEVGAGNGIACWSDRVQSEQRTVAPGRLQCAQPFDVTFMQVLLRIRYASSHPR